MSTPKKNAAPLDLGLKTAYDELFMDDKGRAENRLPKIYDIPLTEIDDFPTIRIKFAWMKIWISLWKASGSKALSRPSHSA